MPSRDQLIEWVAQESEAFAKTIRPDTLAARVPGCPEWALTDLVGHLARVQTFWAAAIRAGIDVPPEFPRPTTVPTAAPELAREMRAATADLIDALRSTPWDATAWAWWRDDHVVGAIGRHQVQEAAVHRWDAQSAVGTPQPLAVEIADDGVDEFLWIARQLRDPAPIVFHLTDSGHTFAASSEPVTATVTATASEVVLLLHGRIATDAVRIDGDRGAVDAFLVPIG